MNNMLAAKILMKYLPEITDEAYKTATKIAIESLHRESMDEWRELDCVLSAREYLGLTDEQYEYWILGKEAIKNSNSNGENIEREITNERK